MSYYDNASLMFLAGGGAQKDGTAYSVKPVPVYGSELVTNGDFSTNTWWTLGQFWSIANGFVTRAVVGSELNYSVSRSNLLTIGKSYKVEIDVNSVDSGSVKVVLGSTNGTEYTSAGVYIFEGVCTSSTNFKISPSSDFNGSIDNVSIKEVLVNGDFTFSRGSNLAATRVDAGPNYYIEKGRENLLLYSQEFDNSYYGKSLGTLTANQTTAPDGSLTADLFTKTSAVNSVSELKKSSPIYASIGVHTYSVYVKQNVGDNVLLRLDSSGNTASALFTFSTKSINPTGSNVIDATATELSDGWFRLSVTGKVTSTSWSLSIATLYANPTNDSVFVWGSQLEQSLAATEYIETTTTTGTAGILENTPRFNYSFGASCPSLLLEGSRTNLIEYSEYIDSWSKAGSVTIPTNNDISPEGIQNASLILPNAGSGTFGIINSITKNTSSITYTLSGFAKAKDYNFLILRIDSGAAGGVKGAFDLSDGTISTAFSTNGTGFTLIDADINPYTNGWYRYEVSFTTDSLSLLRSIFYVSNVTGNGFSVPSYTANGTNGILFWGAQMESNASYATSYIPNHSGTGTITRAADDCYKTGISSLIGQTKGTILIDVDFKTLSGTNMFISIRPDSGNKIEIYRDINLIYTEIASSNSFSLIKTGVTVGRYKIAFAYSSGSNAMYINGDLISSNSTSFAFTSTLNDIYVNSRGGSSYIEQSEYSQVQLYKERLTNAELAALTTI